MRRAIDTMLTAEDVTDKLLPELKMPVLIEWGELDRITPATEGRTIHQLIPQSQLNVIAGCGHLAPLECAGQIGPQVVAFVQH
jgi:pimeloyl-ACP methyl ester carboxylesterase